MIALRLERMDSSDGKDSVWMELPADEQALSRTLEELGAGSFDDCRLAECVSRLPSLEYKFAPNEDIEKINLLAERLAAFPNRHTWMKYKAILSLECFPDLDEMLDLSQNLDCYDYDLWMSGPAEFAENALKEAGFIVVVVEMLDMRAEKKGLLHKHRTGGTADTEGSDVRASLRGKKPGKQNDHLQDIDKGEPVECRRLTKRLEEFFETDHFSAEEIKALLYERAEKQYQAMEIPYRRYRAEQMADYLKRNKVSGEFDEEAFSYMAEKIVVQRNRKLDIHLMDGRIIPVAVDSGERGMQRGEPSEKEHIHYSSKTSL